MKKSNDNSRNETAKYAKEILVNTKNGFFIITKQQRKTLIKVLAEKKNINIKPTSFDMIRFTDIVNLDDEISIIENLNNIIFCEIKSTNRKNINQNFKGFFFAITENEKNASNLLGKNYKFIFVNTITEYYTEMSFDEIINKKQSIYPTWSIRF